MELIKIYYNNKKNPNEKKKKKKEQEKILEKQKSFRKNENKANYIEEEKKIESEEKKPNETIKKEQLVSNFKIKFKKNRKSSNIETINLNQNNSDVPNNENQDLEVNIDTSKKENIKIDISNFNFNDEILIKLVIERMKEIKDKIKNNKQLPELGIKKDLRGQPDYRNEKSSSINFNVIELYQRGIFLANKIIKKLSDKTIPFSHISVNILLDCSGFIIVENKLKQFVIICGIINALNIVNISYAISLVGDSQFDVHLNHLI